MSSSNSTKRNIKRRDFLAGVSAFAMATPWLTNSAFARPSGLEAAPDGARIARVGVFPAIGISRVGSSPEFFLAPEAPGVGANIGGTYKDASGRVKKQAQRFRVYAFDDKGRVIKEVTNADATIEWRVGLANAKAAWYGFNNPMDNGEAAPGLPGPKRNQFFVSEEERDRMLVIDAGREGVGISGADTNKDGSDAQYNLKGKFWDEIPVGLGQLRTDEAGRLLVLPADGVSKAVNAAFPINSFADNDGWHDDWCDGPVEAVLTLADGSKMTADSSWVACVGPNFAPEIPPVTTLYDVVADLNWSQKWSAPLPDKSSFVHDIFPTFQRLALMEWVASAANMRSGWLDVGDFLEPDFIEKLRNPAQGNKAFREEIFDKFRNPYNTADDAYITEQLKLPYMTGDGINYDGSPLQWFQFPKLQYEHLRRWRDGNFEDDWGEGGPTPVSFDDIPLADQPLALTEAALEPCSGGAFHPGVELTYYLRHAQMYARDTDEKQDLFRLAHAEEPESIVQNLGRLLTPEILMNGFGDEAAPIGPQIRGGLTRWMGLPWQCDAFSCQAVRMQENFPTAVWWPALLPIDVLPEEYYNILKNPETTPAEQAKFFENRVAWSRDVAGTGYHANAGYWDGLINMISLWERMGYVVKKTLPENPDRPNAIPDEVYVEVERRSMEMRFDWKKTDGVVPN